MLGICTQREHLRVARQSRLLADRQQDPLRRVPAERQRRGERHCDHQTALRREPGGGAVAAAVRLRDQRVDADDHADREEHRAVDPDVGDRRRRQLVHADVTEQHRVDEAHQHGGELRRRGGDRQREQRADLGAYGAHGRLRDAVRGARSGNQGRTEGAGRYAGPEKTPARAWRCQRAARRRPRRAQRAPWRAAARWPGSGIVSM